jgi:ribosome-binding factor A
MPSKLRLHRIADRIRQVLSEMVIREIEDPRISGISITDVKVDRELSFADIYVSAVEGRERSREVLEGLRHASGYIRASLAAQVDLRTFPKIRFHWDPTPENADHIEQLLASIREKSGSNGSNEQEDS